MVHINRNWLLTLAFLLCMAASAFGQNDWDAVLDRYERISRQCLELRAKVAAGEAVADRSVAGLLQELAQLKNTLQGASGAMTPAQRKRFARIRDDYARATGVVTTSDKVQPKMTKLKATVDVIPSPQTRPALASLHPLTAPSIALAAHEEKITLPVYEGPLLPDPPAQLLHGFLLASVSIPDPVSYGVMAGMTGWRRPWYGWRLGGYVSGRSNFHAVQADYSCNADGSITGGGRFWGDGTKDHKAWSVCAGPVVRLGYLFSIYAGGGLGARTLYWHDVGGQWAEVTDQSFKGLDLEAGAIASWRHLALSAGINWLVPARQAAVSFGLGFAF